MILGLAEREARSEAGANIWPFFADDELDAVAEVLRSGRVNQWTGPSSCRCAYGASVQATRSLSRHAALWPLVSALWEQLFADVDRDSGNITAARAGCF